ncbi:hypothetical protein EMIT0P12_30613 [Pseudomonas sp. IT-P12]
MPLSSTRSGRRLTSGATLPAQPARPTMQPAINAAIRIRDIARTLIPLYSIQVLDHRAPIGGGIAFTGSHTISIERSGWSQATFGQ